MGQSTKRVETMKLALVFVLTAWITNTIAQRGPGLRVPGREPGIRGRTNGFEMLDLTQGAPGNRRGPPIMSFEELNERTTPGRRGPPRRGSSKQKGKKNNNKESASRTQQGPPRSLIERGVLKGPYRACQNVVGNGRFTCPQGQNQTVFPEKECSELTPSMDLPSLTSQKEAQVCQEVGVELTIIGCWVCVVENAGVISVAGSVQGVDLTVVTTCKESGEEGRPANDGQCSLT